MKTTFKYDDKNRLILEIDSSCNKKTNPNAYVEFMTEYKYNANDSIIAEINSGRVLSKETFKPGGKTTFEYKVVHK